MKNSLRKNTKNSKTTRTAVRGGVKERSWKKVRTITVPGVDAIGQTIDGVTYNGNADYGVKKVEFATDEDGNTLEGHGITAVNIKFTTVANVTSINQGFIGFNGNHIRYFTGPKPTANSTFGYEESIEGISYFGQSSIAYATYYRNKLTIGKEITSIYFTGHEDTSILGEGATLEFYAYGYWDEENN